MSAEENPAPRLVAGAEQPAPPEPAAPRRRVSRRRLLIAALPLALALGGGYAWVTGGRYIETEDAYVQQNRVSVVPQVSGQIAGVASPRTSWSPPASRSSASTTPPTATPSSRRRRSSPLRGSMWSG